MTSFEGRVKSITTKDFENEKKASDDIVDKLAIYLKANGHRIHVLDKIYLDNYPGTFMTKTKLIICLKESLGPEFDCYLSKLKHQDMITIEIVKQFGEIKPKDVEPRSSFVDFSPSQK